MADDDLGADLLGYVWHDGLPAEVAHHAVDGAPGRFAQDPRPRPCPAHRAVRVPHGRPRWLTRPAPDLAHEAVIEPEPAQVAIHEENPGSVPRPALPARLGMV